MPGDRPHQRRLPVRVLFRVDVRTVLEKQFRRRRIATARDEHERRAACRRREVRVRSSLQESCDDRRAGIARRDPQGCDAKVVGRIHCGVCSKKQLDGFLILVVSSPLERRGPIARALVDIDAVAHQRPRRSQIALLDRLYQLDVARGGPKRRGREREHDEESARRLSHAVTAIPSETRERVKLERAAAVGDRFHRARPACRGS